MSLVYHGWPADGHQPNFISVTSQRQPRFFVPTRGRSLRPGPHPCSAPGRPSHGGQGWWCLLHIGSALSRDRMADHTPRAVRRPSMKTGGFTLPDVLVVVSLIGILSQDLHPAHRARRGPVPLQGRRREHRGRPPCDEGPRRGLRVGRPSHRLRRTTGVAPSGTPRNIQVTTAGGVRLH